MVALLVSIGLVQIAGYWFAGAMVNGDGPLAIPQPDTALYLQSAARVAAGHPFSFSEGSAVSTGSTTVLHPFLFAIPSLLGVQGFTQVAVFFWINAGLYLVFLLGWCAAFRKWIVDDRMRLFACLLLALCPQPAYAALALSDIGLWLAFSGSFAAALAHGRRWACGALLALGPWIRPEGMILVVAFSLVVLALRLFARERFRKGDDLVAILGVASLFGVFALNHALTGNFQFSSCVHKGYFANEPFAVAVLRSANDLLDVARAFFFGESLSSPRHFYMIPIVGGLAFWIGAFAHDWKAGGWRQHVLPLAMAGSVWTVATSGWQDTNVDRYLAWVMPLVMMLAAAGYVRVARKVLPRTAALAMLTLPLLFSAGSSVVFWSIYNASANQSDTVMKFGRELDGILPADASVGLTGLSGLGFPLRNRHIANLSSVYSPEFRSPRLPETMETLKNRPGTRFTHWLLATGDGHTEEFEQCQTNVVAIGPDKMKVVAVDWSPFDRAAVVPTNGVRGLALRFRVDVGDPEDERAVLYEVTPRYGMLPMQAFSRVAPLDGGRAVESGRVVWGFDEMYVPLDPGRDVTVVMRTMRSVSAATRSWLTADQPTKFDFGEVQKLAIAVDGAVSATCEYAVSSNGFTDAVLRIPGKAVVRPVSRIGFMGDHVACCYWFFQ